MASTRRASDGTITRGPVVRTARVPVTAADRIAFTRAFVANSPVGGRDANGGMSAAPGEWLTDKAIQELAASNTFAPVMGPFTQATPIVAADGSIWVERSAHAGSPSAWDVFDVAGRHVRQVTLPARRRLLALGRASAYLVATDDDGLERLERYAIR